MCHRKRCWRPSPGLKSSHSDVAVVRTTSCCQEIPASSWPSVIPKKLAQTAAEALPAPFAVLDKHLVPAAMSLAAASVGQPAKEEQLQLLPERPDTLVRRPLRTSRLVEPVRP
jgi:hypothetical protein